MTRRSTALAICFAILATSTAALAADHDQLTAHVEALTRPEMEGRNVGSEGHDLARDYIVEAFERAGLEPAGEEGWFTPTQIVFSVRTARATELEVDDKILARDVAFRPLGFSDDGEVSGELFFVGYGISHPRSGWDDYEGIDVRDAIVVALTDGPPGRDDLANLTTDDAKAATALSKGARGFLLINAPRTHGDRPDQRPDELGRMRPSDPLSGISAGRLTARAGTALLDEQGHDLAALQQTIDDGRAPASLPLGFEATMTLAVERESATVDNIVARVPTSGESGSPVVLGAHYDHLGDGIAGSLWEGEPRIHPGADDNASGIAVLIEAGRRLAQTKHRRPILIVATTGEEIGLRGARRLARTIPVRRAIYLNLDMVGRLRDPGLKVLGLERAPQLRGDFERAADSARITMVEDELYTSSSDHIAFAEAGFLTFHMTTGRHPDYHQPTDTPDRLNAAGMLDVTQFVTTVITSLAK